VSVFSAIRETVLGMMKASSPPMTPTPSKMESTAAAARGRKRASTFTSGMSRLASSSAENTDTKTSGTLRTTTHMT
jgi:hypothetical protein